MSQSQQAQNMEFLRRNINHLTFEEVERYAWLAGASSLQSMAVRAQEYVVAETERIEHEASKEAYEDGMRTTRQEMREILNGRVADLKNKAQQIADDIRQHADSLAEDARRAAKVIDEKADELSAQLDLLGSAL